jgi:glycosyltransferase involved in cell wall biosynthesis
MTKVPISVIIPHFNRPQLLGEALNSIQSQTSQPSEIIIVDDNSSDEARREIAKFKGVARIHHNATNVGVSEARNVGVELSSNPWLAFLDDDDLYHSKKLELQWEFLSRHPKCEALGGPLLRVTPDGNSQVWGYREQRRLHLRDALFYTASSMCSMLIRRSAYRRAGGMDGAFRQMGDLEFGIRLLHGGCHMETLPEPLVTYRHGGRDEMSLRWGKTCRAHFRIIHRHERLYRQEFGPFGALQEYARRAKFYGLRKGRILGRSMWAAGCTAEWLVGGISEPASTAAASAANDHAVQPTQLERFSQSRRAG